MKRFLLFCAVSVLLCLAGCSLRTYTMDEILPDAADAVTLLPQIDAVTVTRVSDGAAVTVSGTDVETLMLVFENMTCTRKKAAERADVYTLSFAMTDPADARPVLYIEKIASTGELVFKYGEYDYFLVNTVLDTAYIESLFAE